MNRLPRLEQGKSDSPSLKQNKIKATEMINAINDNQVLKNFKKVMTHLSCTGAREEDPCLPVEGIAYNISKRSRILEVET